MVQCQRAHLDASFATLSDATRCGILERLGRADASITDLVEKFHMTLTGMKKHVGVLEQAGLVTTEKVGRVRTCKLGLRRLEEEAAWIERYRQLWDARFDELDMIVEELKRSKESIDEKEKVSPTPMKNPTTVERKSERELVVTRTFNGPAHIVFAAWTKPELLKRWWGSRLEYPSFRARPMFVRGARTVSCSATLPLPRRYWSCTNSIPQSKPSTTQSPLEAQAGQASSSSRWTHFSSPW